MKLNRYSTFLYSYVIVKMRVICLGVPNAEERFATPDPTIELLTSSRLLIRDIFFLVHLILVAKREKGV